MKRKEQKEHFLLIAGHIKESGTLLRSCFRHPKDSDEDIKRIKFIEREADESRDLLDQDFKRTKSTPYLALDKARLLRKMDNVLDSFVSTAYTIKDYGESFPDDFPDRIVNVAADLEIIANLACQAITTIFYNFDRTFELVDQLEDKHHVMMAEIYQILADVFQGSDENGWKQFYSVKRVLDRCHNAVDQMKDAVEVLQIMTYKYD